MSSNLDVGPFGGGNTAVFQDVQASGVAGQSYGSSNTVVQFNTEVIAKNFISISSNQFTIELGKYMVTLYMSFSDNTVVKNLQFWIRDTSNVSYGGIRYGNGLSSGTEMLEGEYTFFIDIPSQKTIELIAESNNNSVSQSAISATTGSEYYQQIRFTKVG